MNIFPNGIEEEMLVEFIAEFQYLNESDIKYFFDSKKYYSKRVANLVSKKYLRKKGSNFVLGMIGIKYAEKFRLYI